MNGFKDGSCKWEFKLIPQTIMLHFQVDKGKKELIGETIRGTELKPRLDKYIKSKLDQNPWPGLPRPENAKKEDKYSDLLYKVKIIHEEPKNKLDESKKVPWYLKKHKLRTSPRVTILCFDETYQAVLEKYVREFFANSNEPGFGKKKKGDFGKFRMKE